MIYGYLRVSSDEQDVNSQKQGVEKFAEAKGWTIEEYITDEGVSGGKDPDKRNLGPLLKKIKKDDVIIASEISRLGRDLYMVMDILHFCMERECIIYTVKDNFTLGTDIQSKVLAFAFGLSAEIERQMIQQRTREGLKLRVKLGVLLGRCPREDIKYTPLVHEDLERDKEQILWAMENGLTNLRMLASKYGYDRDTIARQLQIWGCSKINRDMERYIKTARKHAEKARESLRYKDGKFCIVSIEDSEIVPLIEADLTIPEIHEKLNMYTYEQIYDTILCTAHLNALYRKHGQKRVVKKKY
ncbi:MAG: recombinase family protein [Paludibacteraceae bacterium]|nr:recombinase family protein [Paludibacteraceae bacterium]